MYVILMGQMELYCKRSAKIKLMLGTMHMLSFVNPIMISLHTYHQNLFFKHTWWTNRFTATLSSITLTGAFDRANYLKFFITRIDTVVFKHQTSTVNHSIVRSRECWTTIIDLCYRSAVYRSSVS